MQSLQVEAIIPALYTHVGVPKVPNLVTRPYSTYSTYSPLGTVLEHVCSKYHIMCDVPCKYLQRAECKRQAIHAGHDQIANDT